TQGLCPPHHGLKFSRCVLTSLAPAYFLSEIGDLMDVSHPHRKDEPPDSGAERPVAPQPSSGGLRNDIAVLAAVISGITGVGAALSLSLPLLSVVLDQRGVSPTLVGINTATAGIAAIAVLPFVTGIAKQFGTARVIIASFVTMAITLMGFYYVESFALWFPLRFIFSSCVTIIFALTEFWINSLAPEHRRGLVVGIYTAFLSIGISIGPLILAVVGTEGILPFMIGSAVLLLAALPVVRVRNREPLLPDSGQRNLLRFVTLAPLALLAGLVFGAVESGGTAILPLYGTAIGLTSGHAVILVSAIAAGNVLSQIPIGYLADRVNRRLLLIACAIVGACGAALMPVVSANYTALLVVLFVTGGIVAGLYTIGLTHLGARYKGSDLASANAAFVLMYALGMLIGPVALGAGLDAAPPHGFAIAIAAIFSLYVLVALLRIGRKGFST
ncbi:MAG: MFS transporter, partial [Pseudomonadota bacterium]